MKCEKCINNCERCKEDHLYCSECKESYISDTEGKCQACPKYCLRCEEAECDRCYTGFSFFTNENGIESNECKKCPENCYSCSDSKTCTECYYNFQLVNNTCVFQFIEHCIKYYERICTTCEPGYESSNGKCVDCPNGECSPTIYCDDVHHIHNNGQCTKKKKI